MRRNRLDVCSGIVKPALLGRRQFATDKHREANCSKHLLITRGITHCGCSLPGHPKPLSEPSHPGRLVFGPDVTDLPRLFEDGALPMFYIQQSRKVFNRKAPRDRSNAQRHAMGPEQPKPFLVPGRSVRPRAITKAREPHRRYQRAISSRAIRVSWSRQTARAASCAQPTKRLRQHLTNGGPRQQSPVEVEDDKRFKGCSFSPSGRPTNRSRQTYVSRRVVAQGLRRSTACPDGGHAHRSCVPLPLLGGFTSRWPSRSWTVRMRASFEQVVAGVRAGCAGMARLGTPARQTACLTPLEDLIPPHPVEAARLRGLPGSIQLCKQQARDALVRDHVHVARRRRVNAALPCRFWDSSTIACAHRIEQRPPTVATEIRGTAIRLDATWRCP